MDDKFTTFVDALYSKYCDDGTLEPIEIPQTDGGYRLCKYVGLDRVQNYFKNVENLRWLDLSSQGIKTVCDPDFDIQQLILKKACSLNLSRNPLKDWIAVCRIVEIAPILQELNLSSTLLRPPNSEEIAEMGEKMNKLKVIVMGDMNYCWKDFLECFKLWPNVEESSLYENKIVILDLPNDSLFLQNLKSLSLLKNPISDWSEINKLGKLAKLETLELPCCKIELIRFNQEFGGVFSNLKYLDLTSNCINDWKSVAELNKLPKLQTLLLKHNPLYDGHPHHHVFNFILGRIKNVNKLDREPIGKDVRNDAEKYYLRTIYLEYLDKKDNPIAKQKFLDENPCFMDLLEKLGEPVVRRKLTKEEEIQQNFINLCVVDEENADPNKRMIRKQFPVTLKVSNLKFILRQLLKIDMDQEFSLSIESKNYEECMEDRHDVGMYRIDPDAKIRIIRFNKKII